MSCNRHDALVNQYLASDIANELEIMAQNDFNIDGHYLPDGVTLLDAATIIRKHYVGFTEEPGS